MPVVEDLHHPGRITRDMWYVESKWAISLNSWGELPVCAYMCVNKCESACVGVHMCIVCVCECVRLLRGQLKIRVGSKREKERAVRKLFDVSGLKAMRGFL